ncbi:uncharacterized protein JCM15063_005151 [Sporobolomyces koalae]|uniref:uncharacterized protein n=1 Tax=Sporobolomyces koalae TaxID=500713 RepID=UPI00316E0E0D
MSAPSSTSPEPSKQPAPQDGFWASLSPADQKKYTLVFLVSLGTTLLVTGRSGGSLLKRAKKSETATPVTPVGPVSTAAPVVRRPRSIVTPSPPPPPQVASKLRANTWSQVAPPPSFLHPNLVSIPKPRRLLPSLLLERRPLDSSSTSSTFGRIPASSYFLPNPTLTRESTRYAEELDRQDKLHEDGTAVEPELVVDDGFNPAVYAAKALGIATLITFSTFGIGIYGIMKWLQVDDIESLSLALSHRLGPTLRENRPTLPAWALPSSTTQPPTTTSKDVEREPLVDRIGNRRVQDAKGEEEEEELSYWTEVKETLDREAEERKRQRLEQWQELQRQKQTKLV